MKESTAVSPMSKIYEMYSKAGLDFGKELEWYLINGIVWSSPTLFLMANTVKRGDFRMWENHGKADSWYFRALACSDGKLSPLQLAFKHIPFSLKWFCWGRRMKPDLKYYCFERVKKLAHLSSNGLLMGGCSHG